MHRTAIIVPAALALIAGCQNAQYQDPQGTTLIVSLNKVDIQDFASAADAMVNSMVEAGVLAKAAHQPALLGISKVENRTDTQFDTDELVKKIRVALLKGGRAQVTQRNCGGTLTYFLGATERAHRGLVHTRRQALLSVNAAGNLLAQLAAALRNRSPKYDPDSGSGLGGPRTKRLGDHAGCNERDRSKPAFALLDERLADKR